MSKVVYGIETFDHQENGTVFYKDGIVNDDLRSVGPGIMESWKYDFSSGKQIFRANPVGDTESDTFYERRLVKDSKGNPYWTNWMEIPMVEAKGIQAIAINSGTLRLPNSDGAIKLEITPALLGVFSKNEATTLIDQKIENYEKSRNDYIPWPDGFVGTPQQVLENEFPEGGYVGTLYIVGKQPGTPDSQLSTQWIWNIVDYTKTQEGDHIPEYGWIQVAGGDVTNAWVSYLEFKAYKSDVDIRFTAVEESIIENDRLLREDMTAADEALQTQIDDHVNDTIRHVTQDDKDFWNKMTPYSEFDEHIENTEARTVDLHVSLNEKNYWNKKPDHIPADVKRYVGSQETWQVAFERIALDTTENLETPYVNGNNQTIPNRLWTITPALPWSTTFKNIKDLNRGMIIGIQLTFTDINTRGLDCHFHTEDMERRSPIFNSNVAQNYTWDMGTETFDLLQLEFAAELPATKPTITGLSIKVLWRKENHIQFGDGEAATVAERLPLDLIGPENGLTYNGYPLAGDRIVQWGDVHGEIEDQDDLTALIGNQVADRMQHAPNDTRRWEVTNGDMWIPSLAQVEGLLEYHFDTSNSKIDDVNPIPHDGTFMTGIVASVFNQLEPTAQLAGMTLKIDFCSSAENASMIYFETDNPKIGRSFLWDGHKTGFEWQIPVIYTAGVLETFDKIIVKSTNGGPSALRQANGIWFDTYSVSYDGVEVSDGDRKFLKLRGKEVEIAETTSGIDDIKIRGIALGEYFHEHFDTAPWTWDLAA